MAKSVKNLAQFEGREQKSHRFTPDNIHFQHPKINYLSMKKKSMVVYVAPNHFSYTKQKSKISSQKEILSKTPKRFKKTSGRLRQNASAFLKKTAAFF